MDLSPIYSRAVSSKRTFMSSSTTSAPSADGERLQPELRLLERNLSARHELAIRAFDFHRHAHLPRLILDRDLDAGLEAGRGRHDVGRAQPDGRELRGVEQRWRQQVRPRAIARALRNAGREIRPGLLAQRGLIDGELGHRKTHIEARLQQIVGEIHDSAEVMRGDDVVVPEPRHRAAAIHEDLQQRFLRDHAVFARSRERRPDLGDGRGRRGNLPPGGLSDTPRAPIARAPRPGQTRSGNPSMANSQA